MFGTEIELQPSTPELAHPIRVPRPQLLYISLSSKLGKWGSLSCPHSLRLKQLRFGWGETGRRYFSLHKSVYVSGITSEHRLVSVIGESNSNILFSVLFNIFFSYVRVRIIKASAYITADNAYEHVSVVPGMKWKTWEVQSQQTGLQWKHNLLFKLTNKKLWKTTKKEALKRRINGSMTNVYVCWSFFWSHQLGDSSSILWDTSSALEL